MKTKLLISPILLLFLSIFLLNSCREETILTEIKNPEKSIASKISFNDFSKAIESTQNLVLKINPSYNSKNEKSDGEIFKIDSTKILFIKNLDSEIFSMRLVPSKNDSDLSFYNLYVQKDKLNNITQTIIKYTPTLETKFNRYKNFKGKYEILQSNLNKSSSNKSSDCTTIVLEWECDNGYVHEKDGPGHWCDAQGSYSESYTICGGGGGGSTGDGNPSGGNGNPGGGSNGNPNGVVIYPEESGDNSEAFDYIRSLYFSNKTWADKNNDLFTLVSDLIYSNDSQSNKDFVNWGINFLIQNTAPNGVCSVSLTEFQNWFAWASSMFNGFPNEDKELFNVFLSDNIHNSPDVLLQEYRLQMSQAELTIFDNMSTGNQLNYLYSAKVASAQTVKFFPDSTRNGKGDAYRHALWNALATRYLGANKTAQLTSAHENKPIDPNNPFEYKEKEMDLYNNSKGRYIGENFPPYETVNQVRIFHITGQLKYLNNLVGGLNSGLATSNSQLIPTNQ